MKLIKKLMIVLAILALSGCAVLAQPAFEKNPNISLEKTSANANAGLVALTVRCDGYRPNILLSQHISIFVTKTKPSFLESLNNPYKLIPIECQGKGTQYLMLNLNPGEYSLYNIAPNGEYLPHFSGYYFNVAPGKVTYIGSLDIIYQNSDHDFFRYQLGHLTHILSNNFKNDLPVFLKKYKNIPSRKYRNRLMDSKQ
jgi:hypothetical protein